MSKTINLRLFYSQQRHYQQDFEITKDEYSQIIDDIIQEYNDNRTDLENSYELIDYIDEILPEKLEEAGFKPLFREEDFVDGSVRYHGVDGIKEDDYE